MPNISMNKDAHKFAPVMLDVMTKIGTAPVLTLQTIRTVPIYANHIPYFFIFL